MIYFKKAAGVGGVTVNTQISHSRNQRKAEHTLLHTIFKSEEIIFEPQDESLKFDYHTGVKAQVQQLHTRGSQKKGKLRGEPERRGKYNRAEGKMIHFLEVGLVKVGTVICRHGSLLKSTLWMMVI